MWNKRLPLIFWTLLSNWAVSAQRVCAGQCIEEILALPEDQIDTGRACLVLAKDAYPDLNIAVFARLLKTLADLQRHNRPDCPIRLALITARSSPAHERVLKTLRAWQVRIDEIFFLGGVSKDEVLRAFQPHIFFDDRDAHCVPAARVAPTAQILSDSLTCTAAGAPRRYKVERQKIGLAETAACDFYRAARTCCSGWK